MENVGNLKNEPRAHSRCEPQDTVGIPGYTQ